MIIQTDEDIEATADRFNLARPYSFHRRNWKPRFTRTTNPAKRRRKALAMLDEPEQKCRVCLRIWHDALVSSSSNGLAAGGADWPPSIMSFAVIGLPPPSFVGVVIGVHRSAFQRHACKKSFAPRIGQNIHVHRSGVVARCLSTSGSRSGGGIGSELCLSVQDLLCAVFVHNHQHEISRRGTKLHTDAALIELVHCRRAPITIHIRTLTANQHTSTVAAADSDGYFFERWEKRPHNWLGRGWQWARSCRRELRAIPWLSSRCAALPYSERTGEKLPPDTGRKSSFSFSSVLSFPAKVGRAGPIADALLGRRLTLKQP